MSDTQIRISSDFMSTTHSLIRLEAVTKVFYTEDVETHAHAVHTRTL
jgi:hypothetical protein